MIKQPGLQMLHIQLKLVVNAQFCTGDTGTTLEYVQSVTINSTRDRRAAGSSLTGVTALWSLSKTHLSTYS